MAPRPILRPISQADISALLGEESDVGCDSSYRYMVTFVDENTGEPLPESELYIETGVLEDPDLIEDERGYVYWTILTRHKTEWMALLPQQVVPGGLEKMFENAKLE